ncbi:hypothetical protein BpHYR1_003752 [Brachionus plicatilis]|uniref:Uncharacterized protein n=1 Tax=Brachionus plicatilis TaxID=10195 RepID=A0A3M7P6Y4_BRAPC|nr:hypothetical protein BpHYR1_003752 [Brachionus plicatilis]
MKIILISYQLTFVTLAIFYITILFSISKSFLEILLPIQKNQMCYETWFLPIDEKVVSLLTRRYDVVDFSSYLSEPTNLAHSTTLSRICSC